MAQSFARNAVLNWLQIHPRLTWQIHHIQKIRLRWLIQRGRNLLIVANADNLAERGVQDQKDEEHIKSQQQDSASVNLSETYINEEEGFSFNYPSAWVPVSEEEYSSRFGSIEGEEYPLVLLANETDDLPEANTSWYQKSLQRRMP